MAVEWRKCTIEDLKADQNNALATGPFGSAISSRFFQDHGVPVIRGSNLSQNVGTRLIDEGLAFVSEEKCKEFRRSIARRGDLVFTCWGTIDQIGLIDDRSTYEEYVISNKQMKLTPHPEKVDGLFLYYVLSSPGMQSQILNQGIGSSVPGFNLGQLRSLQVTIPPLREQQAIACILGAFDDKIELNRRRNRTLEGMARAIFQSWFVDFDPVRKKCEVRRVKGEKGRSLPPSILDLFPSHFELHPSFGPIPAGWRAGRLGEIANEVRDSVSPAEIASNTPYIALEHIPIRCLALESWGMADGVASGKLRFRRGDILFGKLRPYFHKVGPAPVDGVCSTDIVVAQPSHDLWYGVVLGHMSSDTFVAHTDRGSTGTKMPRTKWRDMGAYEIAMPDSELAAQYTRLVEPMMAKIQSNIMESRTLAALRDALLPKLTSGELRVPDAERIVGRAV